MRLKEGLYYIIPYEQNAETFMPDWHLMAEHLVNDAKHYIGYYSALQIHNLITQPSLKEQIVVSKQIRPSEIKIKDVPFQFIYHNEKHFLMSMHYLLVLPWMNIAIKIMSVIPAPLVIQLKLIITPKPFALMVAQQWRIWLDS